jgi:alpha-tubulin suppressor-like RCC1 family protein
VGNIANVSQVVATNSATYALANGMVHAWGANNFGELGNGTTVNSFTKPVQVAFPPGVSIAYLSNPGPQATELAVDTTGQAWGWGDNEAGQLCLGNTTPQLTPKRLPFAHVSALTGGGTHAIYVNNGVTEACGDDSWGQLGNGVAQPGVEYTSPVVVKGLPGVPSQVFADHSTSEALIAGTLYAWGNNTVGQVGNGTSGGFVVTPYALNFPAAVTTVSLGGDTPNNGQNFATLANGRIFVWGDDAMGQLCDGENTTIVTRPEQLILSDPFTLVASGGIASYGIDASGRLFACGSNKFGQLGLGTTDSNAHPKPIVVPGMNGVTIVSSTANNVVAQSQLHAGQRTASLASTRTTSS